MGKQRRTDDRREVLGSTDTCTHGSNFTRTTVNLELEMFVTGENLLKERMNTKSHKRCFKDALEIIASEAKQDDSLLSVFFQCERVKRSWIKPPMTARRLVVGLISLR